MRIGAALAGMATLITFLSMAHGAVAVPMANQASGSVSTSSEANYSPLTDEQQWIAHCMNAGVTDMRISADALMRYVASRGYNFDEIDRQRNATWDFIRDYQSRGPEQQARVAALTRMCEVRFVRARP